MTSLTLKPINGNFQLQKIMMTNLDPYLIIKYGNQELFTSAAQLNQKYLNWNDVFKINLIENQDNFEFECWDYNVDNEVRQTDLIAQGQLDLKSVKFDISNNSSFHWINLTDSNQQMVGEILLELIIHKKTLSKINKNQNSLTTIPNIEPKVNFDLLKQNKDYPYQQQFMNNQQGPPMNQQQQIQIQIPQQQQMQFQLNQQKLNSPFSKQNSGFAQQQQQMMMQQQNNNQIQSQQSQMCQQNNVKIKNFNVIQHINQQNQGTPQNNQFQQSNFGTNQMRRFNNYQ